MKQFDGRKLFLLTDLFRENLATGLIKSVGPCIVFRTEDFVQLPVDEL